MSGGPNLTARIRALLDGPLVVYLGESGEGERSEWPLGRLREPETVAAIARDWGVRQGYEDRRVQVTQWSKFFWRAVLPPWVLAAWLGGSVELAGARLVCIDDEPAALSFEALAGAVGDPVLTLAPWVEAMASAGRMSPRLIWSNAGNLLHAIMELLPELEPGLVGQASALRAAWLERRYHDGGRHPLFAPVRWLPGSPPQRIRRMCCLRYRDPALGYCATCPLTPPPASASASRSASRADDSGPPKNQVSAASV